MEGPWSSILAAVDSRRFVSRRPALSVVLGAARNDLSTSPVRHQDGALVALSHIIAWSACTSQLIPVVVADVRLDTDKIPDHNGLQVFLLTPAVSVTKLYA